MKSFRILFVFAIALTFALVACDSAGGGTTGQEQQQPDPSGPGNVPPSSTGDGPALDPSIFPEIGTTDFITANAMEELSAGTNGYNRGHNSGEAYGDAAADEDGAGANTGEPSTEPEPMPEPDVTREIVEADIFKLEGDILYVLNRWRGLVVIDMSEPDDPEIIGRLPFQAKPVDMYVREGRAYIVMSDYFVYWQFDPEADPLGFHGSQVLIADVSDPANPVKLDSFAVDGEVTDTRMVGDVLYTVSKRNPDYWRYNTADWEDRTWIASLNVGNPEDIREVDRITFQGTSTLIHVAHHAIFVAAVDPNYYLTAEGYEQETLVTYVDISEPDGVLRERGSVYIPGYIADRFKMSFHDTSFRIFSQRWYGSSDGWIFVVDVSYPDQMEIVGQLGVSEAEYGYLQATAFSGTRAAAVTSRYVSGSSIEELHTFDLSDPTDPRRAATLRIDDDVSHFEVRGDRLVALGRTDGYGTRKVSVMLFDIADIEHPALLSRVLLGSGYSYSTAASDYKAFRVIDEMGLILVPLSYSANYDYFVGTQLVDWTGDELIERGRIENVSQVQRAFPVGDRLVAFSERQLQVINASDRDNPVVTADMYLVRYVLDVFDIQGRQVQLIADIEEGGYFFDVMDFGPHDDRPVFTRLTLPFTSQPFCIRDGDVIHMVAREGSSGQVIRNADFSNVMTPRLVGYLELSNEADSVYYPGYSFYFHYWYPTTGLPMNGSIMPFTERHIVELPSGRREWESELRLVDLSDLEQPRLTDGRVPMNDYPFVNKVTHGNVLHSTHVEQATTESGESLLYHVRSYVDRIDVSDTDEPVELPSLNIPGQLVDTNEDGTLLYTIDYQWDDFGRRRNSINVLRVEDDVAVLMDVLPVSDQVNRAVFRDRTIWLVAHKYPWWGVQSDTVSSRQPYTLLHKYEVGLDGTFVSETTARLDGYHFDLLDVEGDRGYFASQSPYGLLILNVANPAEPTILHAARSIGYISRIVAHDDYVYTPLGWYGVHRTHVPE